MKRRDLSRSSLPEKSRRFMKIICLEFEPHSQPIPATFPMHGPILKRMRARSFFPYILLVLLATLVPNISFAQLPGTPKATISASLNVSALQPGKEALAAVVIEVPEGLHAQSHTPTEDEYIALVVTFDPQEGYTIGQPRYPPGEDKTYPALGKINVYEGKVVVQVPITPNSGAAPGPVKLTGKVRLQMCDDETCFFPQTTPFTIETNIVEASASVETNTSADFVPLTETAETSGGKSVWYWYAIAFGAGIIFNLMPCVLPVLPIKAIGFYEAAQHSRFRSVGLAMAFTVGIVAVFAALAVLILVTKQLTWGAQFSNPWFVWPMVAILAVMGIALMGTFSFNLPTAVYNFTPRHDTVSGNVGFGVLTAILSTPCTAPLFPGLLFWAQTQATSVGVGAMLMVGVGMASPYVVLSAFPDLARRMPRVGPWAELFKQMMGWLLIGSAVFFAAGRMISGANFLWAIAIVGAIAGVFLIVRTIHLGAGRRGIAIASVLAAIIFTAPAGYAALQNGLLTPSVKFTPYSQQALADARATGRPVVVKFTANWCGNCQYIEATVFHDRTTVNAFEESGTLAIKVDLTHEGAPGSELLAELHPGGGIPFTAVYLPGEDKPVQLTSIYTTATLVEMVKGK